jgi:hypothetical protein
MKAHQIEQFGEVHKRFVSRSAGNETVWGLVGPNDCYASKQNDNGSVLMFWSDRDEVDRVKKARFQDHEAREVSLFDFLFRDLPRWKRDSYLAGINFNSDLAGTQITGIPNSWSLEAVIARTRLACPALRRLLKTDKWSVSRRIMRDWFSCQGGDEPEPGRRPEYALRQQRPSAWPGHQ